MRRPVDKSDEALRWQHVAEPTISLSHALDPQATGADMYLQSHPPTDWEPPQAD
jgi:hypothetical protein